MHFMHAHTHAHTHTHKHTTTATATAAAAATTTVTETAAPHVFPYIIKEPLSTDHPSCETTLFEF